MKGATCKLLCYVYYIAVITDLEYNINVTVR